MKEAPWWLWMMKICPFARRRCVEYDPFWKFSEEKNSVCVQPCWYDEKKAQGDCAHHIIEIEWGILDWLATVGLKM